jgi:GntR family transcriptional repressor for pyruvate dehydrogenase complex
MSRLHRGAMKSITDEIVSGKLPAGAMLQREVDLAEQFEISRGVARETIRALEERGLVSVRHGRGATVNASEHWDIFDPDVLLAVLATEGGRQTLHDYLECRRILEVAAVGVAARRATDEQKQSIRSAFEQMEAEAALPPSAIVERRFHEADVSFHQAVMAATGNQALGTIAERIHSALVIARFESARPDYRLSRAIPEHRRIMDAIIANDAGEATAAMNAHLDTVASYLSERIPPTRV